MVDRYIKRSQLILMKGYIMCRARPGPRCSNSGAIRNDRAEAHFADQQDKYNAEATANGGTVTPQRQQAFDNAQLRLAAAQRVWHATPKGMASIQDQIDVEEHRLTNLPRGTQYSNARKEHNKTKRVIVQLKKQHAESVQFRKDSYADLHLVKGDVKPKMATSSERRQTRDESRVRGGDISKNAQPLLQDTWDAQIAENQSAALSLGKWAEDDYARVGHWVEKGTDTGWKTNARLRPAPGLGESQGPAVTRMVRENLPDGQVVEGRADIHLTKKSNKFIVSSTLTVAGSFEDASPVDITTQPLGHLIAGKRGLNRKLIRDTKEFNSKAEAEKFIKSNRNSLNQTFHKDVAKVGRDGLIGRAEKAHNSLQNRGFPVWPRYAKPEV